MEAAEVLAACGLFNTASARVRAHLAEHGLAACGHNAGEITDIARETFGGRACFPSCFAPRPCPARAAARIALRAQLLSTAVAT